MNMTTIRKYIEQATGENPDAVHERVSISCPHCWGTGDMALFDGLESKQKRDCVFCDGKGHFDVEHGIIKLAKKPARVDVSEEN